VKRGRDLFRAALLIVSVAALAPACKDVSSFATRPGESYCGSVVQGPFVRAGLSPAVQMRLKLDTGALSTAPGSLSTSDNLFKDAPLRAIPQVFHDPLSTLQFGEGRQRNLLYVVDPTEPAGAPSVFAVLSLMENGDVEVRLLRGAGPASTATGDAPDAGASGAGGDAGAAGQGGAAGAAGQGGSGASGAATIPPAPAIFGIFPLERRQGECGFSRRISRLPAPSHGNRGQPRRAAPVFTCPSAALSGGARRDGRDQS
jgi:hypothetical protein